MITNLGGQVQVGPNVGGNFVWAINGGSNWVLSADHPEAWERLPLPADDLRVDESSTYAERGVR